MPETNSTATITDTDALAAFCRSPAFAAKAGELGGYDLAEHGRVHWNGP